MTRQSQQPLFDELSGATFSVCERYRYLLWRCWDPTKRPLVALMLNPSTADAEKNDPTIERVQRRAIAMGAGGLRVINIFAYRSTDPQALYAIADPIGPDNDETILDACLDAHAVMCGWGGHGALHGRAADVIRLLRAIGVEPMCLGQNADGSPKHPLYVSYSEELRPYEMGLEVRSPSGKLVSHTEE